MEMRDLLTSPQAVVVGLDVSSKKQAFQHLSKVAARQSGATDRMVFDMLTERERLGSTAVGHGVAIPHARPEGIDRIYAVFAQLADPIPFDAPDDQPVDLIFLMLAPAGEGADHLKALARVARSMRNAELCSKIRAAGSASMIFDLLTEPDRAAAE